MAHSASPRENARRTAEEQHYGEHVFRPQDEGEGDRIDLGALAYDATTTARLRELGVGPGWRCLDVGAGTGTVARALLREAGAAEVVAVDRDVRFLAAEPTPGLTALEADITSDGFAPGRFDLVHARFVLMHLPDPGRMIDRLAAMLAPGGLLVVSDAVDLTTRDSAENSFTSTMRAMWQGLHDTIGTDVTWVPNCPRMLGTAGLESVAAEIHVPPLVPGSPINRFWVETWQRARPAMTATRLVDEATIDDAIRCLDAPGFHGFSPGMLTAWGRRP
ncbi:class I SAM-dependent methyltransferase [Streptomyces pristinaespiralis]|uniref:class I SAM-dependent methyltransferase n=1 Tax=Streptomyces pristinaespiralis TaxID=38300 RepID=UPI0037B1AC3F